MERKTIKEPVTASLHRQDRPARSADPRPVPSLPGLDQALSERNHNRKAAKSKSVAIIDLILAMRQHRLAVQGSAVGAAHVNRAEMTATPLELAVSARNAVLECAEVGQIKHRFGIDVPPAPQH